MTCTVREAWRGEPAHLIQVTCLEQDEHPPAFSPWSAGSGLLITQRFASFLVDRDDGFHLNPLHPPAHMHMRQSLRITPLSPFARNRYSSNHCFLPHPRGYFHFWYCNRLGSRSTSQAAYDVLSMKCLGAAAQPGRQVGVLVRAATHGIMASQGLVPLVVSPSCSVLRCTISQVTLHLSFYFGKLHLSCKKTSLSVTSQDPKSNKVLPLMHGTAILMLKLPSLLDPACTFVPKHQIVRPGKINIERFLAK